MACALLYAHRIRQREEQRIEAEQERELRALSPTGSPRTPQWNSSQKPAAAAAGGEALARSVSVGDLRKRAAELGAAKSEIDAALNADDRKQALLSLIGEKQGSVSAVGDAPTPPELDKDKSADEVMGFDMELEAVHHLGVVLSLAPEHPKANNTVANWLALRGDRVGAAEHYARAGEHSDMGISSLPAIAPVAHGYPHATNKRMSSALTARFAEPSVGHWNNPTDATSASQKSRFLLNDRISEKYGSNHGSPKQLMNSPSSAGALAMVAVSTPDHRPSLEMGALPLMPSNGMIEPHSNALIVANPVPALMEARQPFGIGRAMTATPSSATRAERATAMT